MVTRACILWPSTHNIYYYYYLENTEGAIKNGQSRDAEKNNTICVGHHYTHTHTCTNTNNTNKTVDLLQTNWR